jgi:hypothetical protein
MEARKHQRREQRTYTKLGGDRRPELETRVVSRLDEPIG